MGFYLQQGYGMMKINNEFANKFPDIGFILSPRALSCSSDVSTLENHSSMLKKRKVKVLFDPQFYIPATNLEKLLKFPYFGDIPFETIAFNNSVAKDFCTNVIEYQINKMHVDEVILPGRYINSIGKDWYDMQEAFIDSSREYSPNYKMFLTLALGQDIVKNKDVFDELISNCISYPVNGFYIVLKSPKYLVDDEEYLYSLLDALISLKVAGKEIIMGYSNQQSIIYGAAGVDVIASGNFRNVRSFDPDIFVESEEDNIQRRGTWYYDANSLSEFKQQQLSLAYRRGLKNYFGPTCEFCGEMINSPNPANIIWAEPAPFKHFFVELRRQWLDIIQQEPKNRINHIIDLLNKVKNNNEELSSKGFSLGSRAFNSDIIDATVGALNAIKVDRKYDINLLK